MLHLHSQQVLTVKMLLSNLLSNTFSSCSCTASCIFACIRSSCCGACCRSYFANEAKHAGMKSLQDQGGQVSAEQSHSKNDKHTFLKHAKHFKGVDLRYHNDLTSLQQSQRQDLSADFNTLKTKGHKPVYRGSSLKVCHASGTHTCNMNGAKKAPDAPCIPLSNPIDLQEFCQRPTPCAASSTGQLLCKDLHWA